MSLFLLQVDNNQTIVKLLEAGETVQNSDTILDQCQDLSHCAPTPPITQQ